MKQKNVIRKGIAAILSEVIAVSTAMVLFPAAVMADDSSNEAPKPVSYSSLPKRLMNGDFEVPKLEKTYAPWYIMGDDDAHVKVPENFYWKTTAYDQLFEIAGDYPREGGSNRNYWDYYHNGKKPENPDPNSKNVAELVAEEQSSLYQNIETIPGARLSWGLSHIARCNSTSISQGHYKDIMALFIGKTPTHELTKQDPNETKMDTRDIFMWMGELLKEQAKKDGLKFDDGTENEVYHEKKEYTVYASPDAAKNIFRINGNNFKQYFSMEKTPECTEEWKCWIIGDTSEAWGVYAGQYDVPEGQTTTTFAFTALSGVQNDNPAGGKFGLNEGNLLDNIKFAITYPLQVSSTGGGSGTVTADMDADGNHVGGENVDSANPHKRNYIEGTKVTITAKADENHTFLGAFIDGEFKPASDTSFYNVSDGTYTHTVEMDKPRYVQLIFVGNGMVMYDPHNGTYNGQNEDTSVKIAEAQPTSAPYAGSGEAKTGQSISEGGYSEWYNPVGDAVPPLGNEEELTGVKKERFIGWYFARGTQQDAEAARGKGALIKSDHTVEYGTGADGNGVIKVTYTSTSNYSDTVEIPVNDGVTFIAEYEYLQRDTVVTDDGTGYEENGNGGTVSLSIEDIDNTTDAGSGKQRPLKSDKNHDSYGYGRLRDTVTMTAAANHGYTFMGWYEKNVDSEGKVTYILKQHGSTLTYGVDTPRTYYALFKKNETTYVSFVSESENIPTTANNTPFAQGSHVQEYQNGVGGRIYMSDKQRTGGEDVFGNTISTGFTVSKSLDENASNTIQWTITVPTDGNANTYIKVREENTGGLFTYDESYVLRDTVNSSYFNKGSIHKVTGAAAASAEALSVSEGDTLWEYYGLGGVISDADISSDEVDSFTDDAAEAETAETKSEGDEAVSEFIGSDEIPESYDDLGVFEDPFTAQMESVTTEDGKVIIKLSKSIGTTISGSTTILYGLVIDNLYAPGASAAIELGEDSSGVYQSADNMNEKVDAVSADNYRDNKENQYYQYEQGFSTDRASN